VSNAGFGLGLMPESGIEEERRLGAIRSVPVAAKRAAAITKPA
jgi:hypothetical protein